MYNYDSDYDSEGTRYYEGYCSGGGIYWNPSSSVSYSLDKFRLFHTTGTTSTLSLYSGNNSVSTFSVSSWYYSLIYWRGIMPLIFKPKCDSTLHHSYMWQLLKSVAFPLVMFHQWVVRNLPLKLGKNHYTQYMHSKELQRKTQHIALFPQCVGQHNQNCLLYWMVERLSKIDPNLHNLSHKYIQLKRVEYIAIHTSHIF